MRLGEIDIDENNNVYIVSCTMSNDFPIAGSVFQPSYGGGPIDGVIVKLDNSLQNLIWSSYYGGEGNDAAYSLALDDKGDLYIAGGTDSDSLVIVNETLDTTFNGGRSDGFVAHISGDGQTLINTCYHGSGVYDQAILLSWTGTTTCTSWDKRKYRIQPSYKMQRISITVAASLFRR